MIDYYFTNIVRRMVEERKLDGSKVLHKKSLEEEVNKGKHTAAEFVGTVPNYSNYEDTQNALSKLLDINFMSTVREMDRTDQYTFFPGAILLHKNGLNLEKCLTYETTLCMK